MPIEYIFPKAVIILLLIMIQICTDFDGTITTRDTIVYVTEQFGAGEDFRTRVVNDIKSGAISVFQGISMELETVKISWEDAVDSLHKNVFLDPGFEDFVKWSKEESCPMTILSSGMTPVVELYTGHLGIPIYAHKLKVSPNGWKFEVEESHRKESVLETIGKKGPIVYIGDGTSDLAAIPYCELLFARRGRYLETYCRDRNIPFIPFSDFHEVKTALGKWIAERN